MNSTVINVHGGNVFLGAEFSAELVDELARGVSPEALRENGDYDVPEGAEEAFQPPTEVTPKEAEDRLEAMEQRSIQDANDANARRNYLRDTAKNVSRQRKMEGFSVNHKRMPRDRDVVETINHESQRKARESLNLACGKCALAQSCRLRDNIGKWTETKGYETQKRPLHWSNEKHIESRRKFLKRLKDDPLAHCDPKTLKT